MQQIIMNNDGTKWYFVDIDGTRAPMDFMLLVAKDEKNPEFGTLVRKRADYYESFGNFAVTVFRINGVRYSGFPESFEQINGLPVIRDYSLHSQTQGK